MTVFRDARMCLYCGKAANPEHPGTARRITGWVTPHPTRLRFQEPTGEVAHLACVEAELRPAQQNQEALFE